MSRPRTSAHLYEFLGITKQQASKLGGLDYLCGLEASELFTLINHVKRNGNFSKRRSKSEVAA